tara:strand:- start:669 stop:1367 length:699 start_codon:yes stop_codon:yes gene_type:complete
MTTRNNIAEYIKRSSLKTLKDRSHYEFFNNIQVYIKDSLPEYFDILHVLKKIENLIPSYFVYNVDSIIVGQFDELLDREVNAMYKEGTLYITNDQADENDMIDDIVHEIAHAVEEMAKQEIYDDGQIKNEFLGKRKRLYSIIKNENFDVEIEDFLNIEYSVDFDDFLYKEVGYPLLTSLSMGLFVSPYAATSLREYFAIGFEEYHLKDRVYLKKISPKLYFKIEELLELTRY